MPPLPRAPRRRWAGAVTPKTRRARTILITGAAVVVALIIVLAVALANGLQDRQERAHSATPSASAPAQVEPTPSESPSTQAPEASPISVDPNIIASAPTSCEAIYSEAMFSSLRALDLPLNDPLLAESTGTALPELNHMLQTDPGLHCSWGLPSELGINTNVRVVDAAESQQILDVLTAQGAQCAEQDGGTLCNLVHVGPGIEDWQEGDARAGENHFLRGNIWIATHWGTVEMPGYTQDIVRTLWP